MQLIKMAEAQMVDASQIQQEMVIGIGDFYFFINV
jgi:hypothetical protein